MSKDGACRLCQAAQPLLRDALQNLSDRFLLMQGFNCWPFPTYSAWVHTLWQSMEEVKFQVTTWTETVKFTGKIDVLQLQIWLWWFDSKTLRWDSTSCPLQSLATGLSCRYLSSRKRQSIGGHRVESGLFVSLFGLALRWESQGFYDRKAWDLLRDEVSGSNTLIPIGVLYSLLSFEAQNIFFACFIFFQFSQRFGPEMSNLQKMPFQNMLQIQCKKCKWEVQIHSKHQISQKCKWDMKIYRKKMQKQFTFNIPASTKQFLINGPYISIYICSILCFPHIFPIFNFQGYHGYHRPFYDFTPVVSPSSFPPGTAIWRRGGDNVAKTDEGFRHLAETSCSAERSI